MIVPVHIPRLLRPLPGADVLVDFRHFFHWEPLAEMHHHRWVKQRFRMKFMQSNKVLHIGVLLQIGHRILVCDVTILLDENSPKRNPG